MEHDSTAKCYESCHDLLKEKFQQIFNQLLGPPDLDPAKQQEMLSAYMDF